MNHATRTVQYSPIALLGSSGDAHTLCLYRQVIDNAEDGCRLAWAVCANGFRLEWQAGLPEGYQRSADTPCLESSRAPIIACVIEPLDILICPR
jgi:hypothetical protein